MWVMLVTLVLKSDQLVASGEPALLLLFTLVSSTPNEVWEQCSLLTGWDYLAWNQILVGKLSQRS